MTSSVRTRFAPSPTGYLHIGGARTALFNYLFARKMGGTFVLRIEDTDHERHVEAATQAIFDGMKWLGLDWDEGPGVGGDYGPYFQSQRNDIYDRYFEKLMATGRVYEAPAPNRKDKDGNDIPGTSDGTVWRFRFNREKAMTLHDMICGDITVDYTNEENTPDMVVRRSDGSYIFHFVNVVDDIEMKITHVIRGEDHVMNTFKHLQLFEALGEVSPIYAHIPLIQNPNGSKMSKRDTGAALGTYPDEGFLPGAVMNFIALLGWNPKDDTEIFSKAELIDRFSLEAVNRSAAKFDITKCKWMNQKHIQALESQEFVREVLPYCVASGLSDTPALRAALPAIQRKVQLLSEVSAHFRFLEAPEHDEEMIAKMQPNAKELVESFCRDLEAMSAFDGYAVAEMLKPWAKEHGVKPGALMYPIRVALVGSHNGPEFGDVFALLGKEESLRRLHTMPAPLSEE